MLPRVAARARQTGRLDVLPDYRCDLYSLGATMYRLATGRAPHTADTVSVLVHLKLCEDPKPVCVVNTAVPKPLSDVIGRLLQRQADQRYQSAYGALRDLLQCEAAMRGECKFPKKLATVDVPMRLRPVTTILGRDDEFERLQSCFQRAQAGDASCVLLSGVSGVGKSSLVSHMVGQLPRHALFGAGKCDAGMASMPGWVFAQVRQPAAHHAPMRVDVDAGWNLMVLTHCFVSLPPPGTGCGHPRHHVAVAAGGPGVPRPREGCVGERGERDVRRVPSAVELDWRAAGACVWWWW